MVTWHRKVAGYLQYRFKSLTSGNGQGSNRDWTRNAPGMLWYQRAFNGLFRCIPLNGNSIVTLEMAANVCTTSRFHFQDFSSSLPVACNVGNLKLTQIQSYKPLPSMSALILKGCTWILTFIYLLIKQLWRLTDLVLLISLDHSFSSRPPSLLLFLERCISYVYILRSKT